MNLVSFSWEKKQYWIWSSYSVIFLFFKGTLKRNIILKKFLKLEKRTKTDTHRQLWFKQRLLKCKKSKGRYINLECLRAQVCSYGYCHRPEIVDSPKTQFSFYIYSSSCTCFGAVLYLEKVMQFFEIHSVQFVVMPLKNENKKQNRFFEESLFCLLQA